MKILFLILLILSIGLTPISFDSKALGIAFFPPPLQQIRDGINPSNVTCAEGKELVLKQSNGLPACLFPSSVEKLINRGWAIHILPDYSSKNNNSEIFKTGKLPVISNNVIYFENTEGYLAQPTINGDYPGIVMIHEWWGLNDNIRDMADNLASHGYAVLAVDLYNGNVANTSEEARKLVTTYDVENGVNNMNSAVMYLETNFSPKTIGSIGWCFGGGQSLQLALNNDSLDATVIYYGSLVTDSEKLSNIDWPVLGIFAELDKGIPVDSVTAFESLLYELGIPNEIHIYPGVDHAFANPSGDRYAPEQAKDAWEKTVNFLNTGLK